MKLNLQDITLLVLHLDGKPFPIEGIEKCLEVADFGSVRMLTADQNFYHPDIQAHIIHPIRNMEEYSLFFIRDFWRTFDTKFCLTAHPDGFIINPESWTDEFLEYDYIGAPWSLFGSRFRDQSNNPAIGNGGFSLRSQKICKYVSKTYLTINDNEDKYYSNCADCPKPDDIKYPSVNLGLQFAQETLLSKDIAPFGFHNWTQYTPAGKYWYEQYLKK